MQEVRRRETSRIASLGTREAALGARRDALGVRGATLGARRDALGVRGAAMQEVRRRGTDTWEPAPATAWASIGLHLLDCAAPDFSPGRPRLRGRLFSPDSGRWKLSRFYWDGGTPRRTGAVQGVLPSPRPSRIESPPERFAQSVGRRDATLLGLGLRDRLHGCVLLHRRHVPQLRDDRRPRERERDRHERPRAPSPVVEHPSHADADERCRAPRCPRPPPGTGEATDRRREN